jgi:hypothetical protein
VLRGMEGQHTHTHTITLTPILGGPHR